MNEKSTDYDSDKFVELIWSGKYDEFKKGNRIPIEMPNLEFQRVETINQPRIKGGVQQTLAGVNWPENYPKDWKNLLIWGDNKLVMSSLIKHGFAGKINLIYIDPPFFTGADFSFKVKVGNEEVTKEQSIIEERAYRDTWSGGIASYLRYMYERLVLMRELLAENGSILVHLDWHVGHYVKIMMDEIFGYNNFLNEIVWAYRTGGAPAKEPGFSRKHDIILYYSKSDKTKFNKLKERVYYEKPFFNPLKDKEGRYYADVILRDVLENEINLVIDNRILKINVKPVINVSAERLDFDTQKPEGLLQILIMATTEPGDIVADFFCGSGTTGVVAEKLGRRWIMCDLSKYAIHLTRKRLLNIHESKDLMDENKKYGKPARPFEIWNIGNYEIIYWKEKEDEYLTFMLNLYGAKPLTGGFKYLHGVKSGRIVHVGSLNAPVTMDEIERVVLECKTNGFTKADILGWEWAYEVNELAKELAKKNGIDLRLIQIPSINEIKSALTGFDLKLLKIPDQIIEKELRPHIRFYEVAYLEIDVNVKNKEVSLRITDFQIPPSEELEKIKDKIKNFSDLIDYWAVDWDYDGITFRNQWQSYRMKNNNKIELCAKHNYSESGKYKIMVKVVDVFGNDTNKIIEVDVK
jgi:adenine-specific DNA-methyltransferase